MGLLRGIKTKEQSFALEKSLSNKIWSYKSINVCNSLFDSAMKFIIKIILIKKLIRECWSIQWFWWVTAVVLESA